MIYGIGIDIIKTSRMQEVVKKWGNRFLKRTFLPDELAYCYGKKTPFLSLAARFAAKEALIKAVGSEMPVSFTEIKISNTERGKPVIEVSGKLQDFFKLKEIRQVHLSMSHEQDYGVACVILEQ